ncbi:MAG: CcdB family protein [Desulfuromusa sp.]|nr:CcdB family protein [Desulfuromusa sp.]
MAQFDVFENDDPESKTIIPFLLDVQHDLHKNLITRSVIPLVLIFPADVELKKLCPRFNVMGQVVALSTPEIAGYPVCDLGSKVMSLAEYRAEIFGAIDFLLSGF